jgi:hypothetical protein
MVSDEGRNRAIDEHLGWVLYTVGSVLDAEFPVSYLEAAQERLEEVRRLLREAA